MNSSFASIIEQVLNSNKSGKMSTEGYADATVQYCLRNCYFLPCTINFKFTSTKRMASIFFYDLESFRQTTNYDFEEPDFEINYTHHLFSIGKNDLNFQQRNIQFTIGFCKSDEDNAKSNDKGEKAKIDISYKIEYDINFIKQIYLKDC